MKLKQYDAQEEARLISVADTKETERAEVATRIQDMITAGESKAWDNDEHLQFRQLKEKHDWLRTEIKDIKSDIDAMQVTKPVDNAPAKAKADPLLRWLKSGYDGLDTHERKDQSDWAAESGLGGARKFIDPIFKAAVVPGDNATVLDTTVVQSVIEGLHAYGGALDCFTIAMTPDGNAIKYPTYDDVTTAGAVKKAVPATGNVAAQQKVANVEGTNDNNTSLSNFGDVDLSAYVRNTNFLDISQFFNEDVRWDVGAFVRRTLMRRMGRTIEEELTTGGITAANIATPVASFPAPVGNEPTGFMARATDTNSSNGSTDKTAIKWEDFNTLIHSVDAGYLRGEMGLYGYPHRPGKTGFMMSWSMLGKVKNLSDSQNRPLIIPSIQDGSMDMLFGYPVFVNFAIPYSDFGTNHNRPIYFGNWGYMVVRFAGAGFAIEEFYDSNTATSNSRRYLGRIRYDSDYIGALTGTKGEAIHALKRNVA